MELDALGLEPEPAEIKQAAHVAVEIVDDILMMYAQNPPGSTRSQCRINSR